MLTCACGCAACSRSVRAGPATIASMANTPTSSTGPAPSLRPSAIMPAFRLAVVFVAAAVFPAPSQGCAFSCVSCGHGRGQCTGSAALRHCGTAALRHCGTAALRRCGTAARCVRARGAHAQVQCDRLRRQCARGMRCWVLGTHSLPPAAHVCAQRWLTQPGTRWRMIPTLTTFASLCVCAPCRWLAMATQEVSLAHVPCVLCRTLGVVAWWWAGPGGGASRCVLLGGVVGGRRGECWSVWWSMRGAAPRVHTSTCARLDSSGRCGCGGVCVGGGR